MGERDVSDGTLEKIKKFITEYPMFSKTISWYLSLGFIFSMLIFSMSWDSDSALEYAISLTFFGVIFYSIPIMTFLISYNSFNKEHKLLQGFFFSVILAIIGLILFKLVIELGFSAGLEIASTSDDIDTSDAGLFDAENWSEKMREWVLPAFTAGLGSLMFVLHSIITKSNTKSKKSRSQKPKHRAMVPDINQVGRISPDGYEWVDMQDGSQWFRIQNSGVPYERYNPNK